MVREVIAGMTMSDGHKDFGTTEEIYVQYKPFLLNYIRKLGYSKEEAEDFTQEVFLICKCDGISNVPAYLCGVAHHVICRYLRNCKINFKPLNDNMLPAKSQLMEKEDEEHFVVRLTNAIASLPKPFKQAIKLVYIKHMDPCDAAKRIRCNPKPSANGYIVVLLCYRKDIFEN